MTKKALNRYDIYLCPAGHNIPNEPRLRTSVCVDKDSGGRKQYALGLYCFSCDREYEFGRLSRAEER